MAGMMDGAREGAKQIIKWGLRRSIYRKAYYRPRPEDKPYLVRLDVNNTCNLACVKCFYPAFAEANHPNHYMKIEDFRRIAAAIFPYTYYLQLACSFEAMMHPKLPEIVREIDRYDIMSCGMVTNGTLLRDERAEALLESRNIKMLSVSIDGITPETYEYTRGRPMLDRVLKNLAEFQQAKRERGKGPMVKVNALVMRSNLGELPKIMDWCVEHGIEELQCCHVEPFGPDNEESVCHCPDEYAALRAELLEKARKSEIQLFFPPPMTPEYYIPAIGKYEWKHSRNEITVLREQYEKGELDRELTRDLEIMLRYPYPRGLPCISPWMTLVIDAHGDVVPCGFRHGMPIGNLLRQSREEATNSLKALRLRQGLLKGRKEETCPMCSLLHPNFEPMTDRLSRMHFSETESDAEDSPEVGPKV